MLAWRRDGCARDAPEGTSSWDARRANDLIKGFLNLVGDRKHTKTDQIYHLMMLQTSSFFVSFISSRRVLSFVAFPEIIVHSWVVDELFYDINLTTIICSVYFTFFDDAIGVRRRCPHIRNSFFSLLCAPLRVGSQRRFHRIIHKTTEKKSSNRLKITK